MLELEYEDANKLLVLKFTGNNKFTSYVKSIPGKFRAYDQRTNTWRVHVSQLKTVIKFARLCFGSSIVYHSLPVDLQMKIADSKTELNFNVLAESTPYADLFVLPNAPMEVVKAAYKALALIHHPDKGGDRDEFEKVKVAYEKIKNERKDND